MSEGELRLNCFHIVRSRYADSPWRPLNLLCSETEELFTYMTKGHVPSTTVVSINSVGPKHAN